MEKGSILEVNNKDAQGIVYKAKQNFGENEIVAIKRYNVRGKEFNAEVQALDVLNSPYIVKMLDHDEDNIVLEYLEGESLKQIMARDDTVLSCYDIPSIMACVVCALLELQKNFIINCDVKPENIIYHKNKYVLIDFGTCIHCSQFQHTCGTPGYCPPEILNNCAKLYSNYDIFSLGKIAYYLACLYTNGCYTLDSVEDNPSYKRDGFYSLPLTGLRKAFGHNFSAFSRFVTICTETVNSNRVFASELIRDEYIKPSLMELEPELNSFYKPKDKGYHYFDQFETDHSKLMAAFDKYIQENPLKQEEDQIKSSLPTDLSFMPPQNISIASSSLPPPQNLPSMSPHLSGSSYGIPPHPPSISSMQNISSIPPPNISSSLPPNISSIPPPNISSIQNISSSLPPNISSIPPPNISSIPPPSASPSLPPNISSIQNIPSIPPLNISSSLPPNISSSAPPLSYISSSVPVQNTMSYSNGNQYKYGISNSQSSFRTPAPLNYIESNKHTTSSSSISSSISSNNTYQQSSNNTYQQSSNNTYQQSSNNTYQQSSNNTYQQSHNNTYQQSSNNMSFCPPTNVIPSSTDPVTPSTSFYNTNGSIYGDSSKISNSTTASSNRNPLGISIPSIDPLISSHLTTVYNSANEAIYSTSRNTIYHSNIINTNNNIQIIKNLIKDIDNWTQYYSFSNPSSSSSTTSSFPSEVYPNTLVLLSVNYNHKPFTLGAISTNFHPCTNHDESFTDYHNYLFSITQEGICYRHMIRYSKANHALYSTANYTFIFGVRELSVFYNSTKHQYYLFVAKFQDPTYVYEGGNLFGPGYIDPNNICIPIQCLELYTNYSGSLKFEPPI
ncbi:hypothetical protein WA158_005195 [Blastocystis sp. Blastoise]